MGFYGGKRVNSAAYIVDRRPLAFYEIQVRATSAVSQRGVAADRSSSHRP